MRQSRKSLYVAFVAVALCGFADNARAQFSMNAIGRDANPPAVTIPVNPSPIDTYIMNASEARVIRKAEWRARNDVDFRVSVTGMVTQFNKSWTTNNQNSVSSELAAYYYHTFTRDKYTSIFKFDGIYGMNHIDNSWFKNQDMFKLYYLSSWKMHDRGALKNWAYSFSSTFASQFAEGYESRTKRDQLWSNFMAPGTVNVGAGLTYTSPNRKLPFIVTLNPISGDALFVLDDRIGNERRRKLGIIIPPDYEGKPIDYKIEGGSSVNIAFNRTFAFGERKSFSLQYITTLNSFYGWMTQAARHNGAGDAPAPPAIMPTVGWNNSFIFNPLKFLTMEFTTKTLYDRSQVDRVQMQYYLRVGLTYRYKNR